MSILGDKGIRTYVDTIRCPLGNAESFVWTAGAGANDNWGGARAGNEWYQHTCGCPYDPKPVGPADSTGWQCYISSVADALSFPAQTGSNWGKAGMQICGTGSSSQIVWIQVELPKAVSCSKTAVIGKHWPKENSAFVEASTDGSTWVTAATWNIHPGSTHSWVTVAESDYSAVSADMSTFGIDLQNSGDKFKYWRIGGHVSSQTNAILPVNWILQCTE